MLKEINGLRSKPMSHKVYYGKLGQIDNLAKVVGRGGEGRTRSGLGRLISSYAHRMPPIFFSG